MTQDSRANLIGEPSDTERSYVESMQFLVEDTRTHVVGELYDTERSYVESLQFLLEKYMKPLKSLDSNKMLIDSNLVDEIFYTIPEILKHHENFLSALQDRLSSDWDTSQVIGNVFIEAFTNQQIIDTYTAFINNWKNARQAIKLATQAKPAFERFLEAMSREHRNKLTLDALLIMPVQRIPRYELLIKELIKHTPEDHPDYELLIIAQKEIHELALKIDRAEREMIHQEQLRDLESLIDGHVELQHPQRDFIRYDLVNILSASALTIAKKERVLFLFCDLLIMTSVKKKASRRSNLQTAFANSSNDLSLLEGNKFKLLLKVPIDQVEIRLENDEIKQHQQQLHQQEQKFQIQQQSRIIQEKKKEIESDLCILDQMETLSSKVSLACRDKINESINELSRNLKERLSSLEQADLQIISSQHAIVQNQRPQLSNEIYSNQPASLTLGNQTTPTHNSGSMQISSNQSSYSPSSFSLLTSSNSNIISSSGNMSSAGGIGSGQQEANTSLEFIISSTIPSKEILSSNTTLSMVNDNSNDQGLTNNNNNSDTQQQQSNCDSLVVTFASVDRRQTFLTAFIEAKQQRFQLQQQQKHKQKIYSTSVTLKLSQPNNSMGRGASQRKMLQHQDNLTKTRSQQYNSNRNSSAPMGHHIATGATIIHQMSAPHSLNEAAVEINERSFSQCSAWNPVIANPGIELCYQLNHNHNHLHHHHQKLTQQPASQPASLDTICCHERHDDVSSKMSSVAPQLAQLNESVAVEQIFNCDRNHLSEDPQHHKGKQLPAINQSSETLILNEDNIRHLIDQDVLPKFSPKFLVTIPVNFLNTQHPSLQFTCSAMKDQSNDGSRIKELSTNQHDRKQQMVRDNLGQLWLCMSNGYVSHIALISIKKSRRKNNAQESRLLGSTKFDLENCYDIQPVIKSAGDICKSYINCAVQVSWSNRKCGTSDAPICSEIQTQTILEKSEFPNDADESEAKLEIKQPVPDVSIKSSSPPIEILSRMNLSKTNKQDVFRLSESAPSPSVGSVGIAGEKAIISSAYSSASTTRLELPTVDPDKSPVADSNLSPEDMHVQTGSLSEGKRFSRGVQDAACHRHYHHKHIQNHTNVTAQSSNHLDKDYLPSFNDRNRRRYAHSYHYSHSHHHSHQHHHHHHYHQHDHGHLNQPHNLYNSRHNTVPIAELRQALEKQSALPVSRQCSASCAREHNQAPSNSPSEAINKEYGADQSISTEAQTGSEQASKKEPSVTPPANYSGKHFRSARLLRHQASLKTSSILAKLVIGAGKRSHLKKSNQNSENKQSDDNDTDQESANAGLKQLGGKFAKKKEGGCDSFDTSVSPAGANRGSLNATEQNNTVVSPLSSVSSLNSTNSSMTINSVCTSSSPNRSNCDLIHSLSTSCCVNSSINQLLVPAAHCLSISDAKNETGIRSRSATMPSCSVCPQLKNKRSLCNNAKCKLSDDLHKYEPQDSYKVSEIINDSSNNVEENTTKSEKSNQYKVNSSLWLGCDDGSLIIIDCLVNLADNNDCNVCESRPKNLVCDNMHSEVKLNAPICDINNYNDEIVFVSLSNGQLVIFYRYSDSNNDNKNGLWSLTEPKLITITAKEINSTSKLCLVDENYLWYSYGRNIFVINVQTLKVETTIMAPTNDLSLQFSVQSITIDNMELMSNIFGVWISFKNSHLIQLYDFKTYKLLLEVNLFEAIDRMLSYGNNIIRQHKTSCLKATSLLNVSDSENYSNTLFIGTSAGIILYLNIDYDQTIAEGESDGGPRKLNSNPQVVSLRHGHSGHVKLLHFLEIENTSHENDSERTECNNDAASNSNACIAGEGRRDVVLISGGVGVDLYGPRDDIQNSMPHLNVDHDNLNHLSLWQL